MSTATSARIAWLEGLRGVAALQVLLLHYCSVFLPYAARVDDVRHTAADTWLALTPLYFLINGHVAVQVFFLISGAVLAGSFLRTQAALPRLVAKRLVRLMIPALAAIAIAVLWKFWLPADTPALTAAVGSDWFARYLNTPWTAAAMLRDALADSILLGYRDVSLFDPHRNADWLSSIGDAIVPPLWTLHVEFWGSMLVLGLAWVRRRFGTRVFWAVFALCLPVTGTSHYTLFLIGMALHLAWGRESDREGGLPGADVMGPLLILAGVILSSYPALPGVADIWRALAALSWLQAPNAHQWQSQWGAVAIIVGVAATLGIRNILANAFFSRLGRLSFSIYLLHFSILASVGTRVFLWLLPAGHGWAMLASLAIGTGATWLAAWAFERLIDRRAIAWSRRLDENRHSRAHPT